MNRRVSRKKDLDSFSIYIDILSNLLDKLLELFNKKKDLEVSITFELKEEILNFDSVEEIRQYAEQNRSFPKRIHKYGLSVHGYSPFGDGGWSYVDIHSDIVEDIMCIRATSDSEAWCAGVIDTVTSFLRQHRVWYYFLYRIKVLWVLGICLLSLLIFKFLDFLKLLESGIGTVIGTIIAWLILLSLIISIILPVLKARIPHSEIRISEQEGFLRRRYREILIPIGIIVVANFLLDLFRFIAKSF